MRTVIQRVSNAEVYVPDKDYRASVGKGLLVLAAFTDGDEVSDLEWMTKKISALRIFDDDQGVMNLSAMDVGAEILVVSQFTLYASVARGNRPSYIKAARPETAVPLYEDFCRMLGEKTGRPVATGIFGADMKVSLLNDGPVTIVIDSKDRE